ncbi:double-strand break repair helicase AddA [Amaricoccus sp.]|uniref:double-strand break repair helicase AddA n=1 Tax=Amaricoccus sp. TaxID=1872485 RepID=UPI001B3E2F9E|nr:double-strand break repair helicase AddA [Amaricoccus sp.]MBP7001396.1 double-strand break repair helicase AddA [Amaricoccus sp.]
MTEAARAQIAAARPGASSWVSANAGSGKTRVLTDRVARLLLAGAEPGRILCLTYTKAAAAEMQTRLFRTLGAWAMLPDAELRDALTLVGEPGDSLPADRLEHARTLFARALETPGGLKIQTIHAFCDGLLRRFPLEAGVPPRFVVLEERQAKALRAETLDALAAAGAPEFAALAPWLSRDDLDPLLAEIGQRRAAFAAPFDPAALARAFGVDPDRPVPPLALDEAEISALRAVAAAAAGSGPADRKVAEALAEALHAADPATRQELLEVALLNQTGAEAFQPRGKFPTKGLRAAHPALFADADAIARRVADERVGRLAWAGFEKSVALNRFARVWLAALGARKAARGLLDFDDLVDRAGALLGRADVAAWVLWRLDGGLDHILVDEAQDTSPAQWRVIEAISGEFFAGLGARGDARRTLFVVGDEKQSIYSFQGADPAAFGTMRERFARMLDDMGEALAQCDLLWSFRSAPPILAVVDATFAGPAGAGLARARHEPIAADAPGRVELWPFAPKPDRVDEGPWDDPALPAAADDPVEALARRIATTIRGWLDARRALPGTGRAIAAGDVAILVQRRGPIFDATIRALKRAGVPVAGADLLRVGAELAVRDLLAALRVVATEADDLSLAALLRSPLGGVTEAGLYRLAQPREGSLWRALMAAPDAPAIRATLVDLRAQADFLRPFELLQRLLVRHDGRRLLVARLGAEAEDGVDALLDQALAYEQVEPPSLVGFLAFMDREAVTVKRRLDEAADQVRVMTVHGAKGLESEIVILPDTAARQEGGLLPQVLPLGDGLAGWRVNKDEAPVAIAAAEARRKAAAAEENNRLLYVALTRARRWLIVAGAGADGPDSWHRLVEAGLRRAGAIDEPGPAGPVLALAAGWRSGAADAVAARGAAATLPDWAGRRPPAPAAGPPPVSPSGLGGAHALPGEGLDEAAALARGAALHRMLEALPGRPQAEWPALAARLAPLAAPDVLAEAAALLLDPALAFLWEPGVLAEVDVTAPLAALGGARMLGRIDRLAVGPERVLAVDFKSNRVAPSTAEATPEAILRQMGAYAAALALVWPGRRVETAVLWTRPRRLMPLPPGLVAAALTRAGPLLDPGGGAP